MKGDKPDRRQLKIFAFDPMMEATDVDRTAGRTLRVAVDIENEEPGPGPSGKRLEVVDYDGSNQRYYEPVNLSQPDLLLRGSLEPTESDPRFHQQMVYAVAMRTLENFDRALGRRLRWSRRQGAKLRILPHAFHGANAFYDHEMHALLFGYFRADDSDPGWNLPGQLVFTCLSHDIVAHEMTHSLIHRLRPRMLEPSNPDTLALHEGFADIVALFQHLTFQDILRSEIQSSPTDLRDRSLLVGLAGQFGYAIGQRGALRSALDKPEQRLYATEVEPHKRGSILVAAVFDAFFHTYQRRIRDLLRIATGGTGRLPLGDMHPDLVNRIAAEATKTAQQVLTMCIRAFDYLPPVDITFGDYLRGMVTADYELNRQDEYGLRRAMIEAFRARGIYPDGVASLAEESLLCPAGGGLHLPFLEKGLEAASLESLLEDFTGAAADFSRVSAPAEETFVPRYPTSPMPDDRDDVDDRLAPMFQRFAKDNAAALGLAPSASAKIHVSGFHLVFRVGTSGRLNIEWVVQYEQHDKARDEDAAYGGVPVRGGTTLIADARGGVRYVIAKPLPDPSLAADVSARAKRRIEEQAEFVRLCDARDPGVPYLTAAEFPTRMRRLQSLRAIHSGCAL